MRPEHPGLTGRLLKGFVEPGKCDRRWRMCFDENRRWCIEFDEDAVVTAPESVEGDQRGRSTVRLKRDVAILEIRSDTIVDILKGCIVYPERPPVINPPGNEDEDGGEVGDPTSRGGPC